MSRMIQLRNVPDSLHRTLKARAAMAGMSLSDYLLAEIRSLVDRPTLAELQERVRRRGGVTLPVPAADAVRREREAR
jgi:antitoxin FitA